MNTSAKIFALAMAASLLFYGSAAASFTTINPGGDGPLSTLTGFGGILDRLYGWNNLQRIDDSQDQIFDFSDGDATAQAKYAGYSQNFGYIADLNDDGIFDESATSLFTVPGGIANDFDNSIAPGPNYQGLFSTSHNFIFTNDPNGASSPSTWYSKESMNPFNEDHMVTYRIIGNGFGHTDNMIGNLVLAWEDKPYTQTETFESITNLGDRDYNDLVVEIGTATPEPASAALLGIGFLGLAALGRKKFVH